MKSTKRQLDADDADNFHTPQKIPKLTAIVSVGKQPLHAASSSSSGPPARRIDFDEEPESSKVVALSSKDKSMMRFMVDALRPRYDESFCTMKSKYHHTKGFCVMCRKTHISYGDTIIGFHSGDSPQWVHGDCLQAAENSPDRIEDERQIVVFEHPVKHNLETASDIFRHAFKTEPMAGQKHILVESTAGSGKTTLLLSFRNGLYDILGVQPDEMGVLVYNKHNTEEFHRKMVLEATTFHSHGYRSSARHYGRLTKNNKVYTFKSLHSYYSREEEKKASLMQSKKLEKLYKKLFPLPHPDATDTTVRLERAKLTLLKPLVCKVVRWAKNYGYKLDHYTGRSSDQGIGAAVAAQEVPKKLESLLSASSEAAKTIRKLNKVVKVDEVYAMAEELLTKSVETHGAMKTVFDFDDLMYIPLYHRKSLAIYPKLKWLLVDEVQDQTMLRMVYLKELLRQNPACRCFAVGDSMQNISIWTGSTASCVADLRHFLRQVGGYKEFTLSYTCRVPRDIVDYTNRRVKDWFTAAAMRPPLGYYSSAGREDEPKLHTLRPGGVVKEHTTLAADLTFIDQATSNAVLCRMNYPLVILGKLLIERGYPVKFHGIKPFVRQVGEYFLSMQAMVRKNALGCSAFSTLQQVVRMVPHVSLSQSASQWDVDSDADSDADSDDEIEGPQHDHARDHNDVRQCMISMLHRAFSELKEDLPANGNGGFTSCLVARASDLARTLFEFPKSDNSITLSTVHMAKGKEFDKVFILEPGLLGDTASIEELNVMFVAFTRSRRELLLLKDCGQPITKQALLLQVFDETLGDDADETLFTRMEKDRLERLQERFGNVHARGRGRSGAAKPVRVQQVDCCQAQSAIGFFNLHMRAVEIVADPFAAKTVDSSNALVFQTWFSSVRKCYKKLALLWHPDKTACLGDAKRECFAEKFSNLKLHMESIDEVHYKVTQLLESSRIRGERI